MWLSNLQFLEAENIFLLIFLPLGFCCWGGHTTRPPVAVPLGVT